MNYCDEIDLSNITAEEWNTIYKHGGFKGEGSGRGSFVENNKTLIEWFEKFITKNFISSIVDIGCGDFQWMPLLLRKFPNVDYIGIDCANALIESHAKKYPDYTFVCKDVTAEDFEHIGQYDLVLCKAVLQHNVNNPRRITDPINDINSRYKILITPGDVGGILRHRFANYTWVTDYQSDEEKSIYLAQS